MIHFSSYALFHASRKTLSTVKSSMIAQWTPYDHWEVQPSSNRSSLFVDDKSAQSFLGILDGGFLGAYAIVSIDHTASILVIIILGSIYQWCTW
jgi:hypothetical protein